MKTISGRAFAAPGISSQVSQSTHGILRKPARDSLLLPMKVERWISLALENHIITPSPLCIDVLMASNRLPWHHKDPADRFIIATAIKENATIVTGDAKLGKYNVKTIV